MRRNTFDGSLRAHEFHFNEDWVELDLITDIRGVSEQKIPHALKHDRLYLCADVRPYPHTFCAEHSYNGLLLLYTI